MAGADGSATFVIDLDASSAGMSAEQAADKLEELNAQMVKARDLSKAWKAAGDAGKSGLEDQKKRIAELRPQIQSLNVAMAKEGVTMRDVTAKRKADTSAAKAQGEVYKLQSKSLANVAMEARVAAVAFGAATASALAFAGGLGALILKSADARRSELLRLEGMTKMRSWWGVARGNASEIQASIDSVAASSAISRDQVGKFAEQLYKAGMRGANLTNALDAMSIKMSTQGEEAAQSFAGWAVGAGLAGHSVKGLADRVRSQLGGIAQKQMLSLDVQWMKFKEHLAGIGKAFNIEPMLRGLNTVLSMFREGAAVGDAWKAVLEAVFGPIFGKGEEGGKTIKKVVQGATIAFLEMATVALKASAAVGNAMPDWVKRDWFGWVDALTATKWALFGVAGVAALAATSLAMILAPFLILGATMVGAWVAGKKLISVVSEVWSAFKGVPWAELGSAIVTGLVDGIKSAASGAVNAVANLAGDIKAAFKDKLGIHSPSTVFAQFGAFTAQGFGQGVERETPRARESIIAMAEPPCAGSYSATTTNSSRSVVIQTLNVTAGSQGAAQAIRDEIARVLEGVALEMGGASV